MANKSEKSSAPPVENEKVIERLEVCGSEDATKQRVVQSLLQCPPTSLLPASDVLSRVKQFLPEISAANDLLAQNAALHGSLDPEFVRSRKCLPDDAGSPVELDSSESDSSESTTSGSSSSSDSDDDSDACSSPDAAADDVSSSEKAKKQRRRKRRARQDLAAEDLESATITTTPAVKMDLYFYPTAAADNDGRKVEEIVATPAQTDGGQG